MFDYARELVRQLLWDAEHHLAVFPKECKYRILVVQEEGLGNAILTTPLIRALSMLVPERSIDVLVNRIKGSDLVFVDWSLINKVWDRAEFEAQSEFVYFHIVLECHPRHELPKNIKFQRRKRIAVRPRPGVDYHWLFKKHETEYLLDMVRGLGYQDGCPPLRNLTGDADYEFLFSADMVAIGIGYYKGLRADGRDWSDRHWGNENFLAMCRQLIAMGFRPVLVGDQKDFDRDGKQIARQGIESICGKLSLPQVIDFISRCRVFIGNDTGLMHVAAAVGIPTVGIFLSTSSTKSHPRGSKCIAIGGDQGEGAYSISPEVVIEAVSKLLDIQ